MERGRPWVRLKAATSLDGATALGNGASQWITSPAARADGHHWRARACAVLTGIGTILADDPQLNVRAVATPRQPQVVVVDSQLRTPLDAKVLRAGSACIIYTSVLNIQKTKQLQALGATVIHLPNAQGQVDLAAMLADLGQRSINELHVEAGAILNGALLAQGLVDELLLYLAPQAAGPGLQRHGGTGATARFRPGAALAVSRGHPYWPRFAGAGTPTDSGCWLRCRANHWVMSVWSVITRTCW